MSHATFLFSALIFMVSPGHGMSLFAPEERNPGSSSGGSFLSNFFGGHDPNCVEGMTSHSGHRSLRRLGSDLMSAAAAGGYRTTATGDASYDAYMRVAIDHMMKNRFAVSEGLCGRYVRYGLEHVGLIPKDDPSRPGAAKDYVPWLQKYCFSNYISRFPTPESAPAGAVLIYDSINSRGDKNAPYGHAEVKTPSGYVSDYYSPNPRTGYGNAGRNRRLIGVMIKPGGGTYRNCRSGGSS